MIVFSNDGRVVDTKSKTHFSAVDCDFILSVDSRISFVFCIVEWVIMDHCTG